MASLDYLQRRTKYRWYSETPALDIQARDRRQVAELVRLATDSEVIWTANIIMQNASFHLIEECRVNSVG